MLISELARLTGISKDAVRLYTKLGLIQPKFRQAGSRKYAEYSNEDVKLVRDIILSKQAGFTLAEIQLLANEYFEGKMTPSHQKIILIKKLDEIHEKQRALKLFEDRIEEKIKSLTVDYTP